MNEYYKSYYLSPLGWVELQASESAIISVKLCAQSGEDYSESPILKECSEQLDAYFNGNLKNFDLPIKQEGTPFQQNVWKLLSEIKFGKTITYSDIACRLKTDSKSAPFRAVGAACGKNKVWIIVPCHRVVGSNGSLTGYAGGLDCKKWLLTHESSVCGLLI